MKKKKARQVYAKNQWRSAFQATIKVQIKIPRVYI